MDPNVGLRTPSSEGVPEQQTRDIIKVAEQKGVGQTRRSDVLRAQGVAIYSCFWGGREA